MADQKVSRTNRGLAVLDAETRARLKRLSGKLVYAQVGGLDAAAASVSIHRSLLFKQTALSYPHMMTLATLVELCVAAKTTEPLDELKKIVEDLM